MISVFEGEMIKITWWGRIPTMLRRRVRTAAARSVHIQYHYTEKMVLVPSNEYWLPPVFNHMCRTDVETLPAANSVPGLLKYTEMLEEELLSIFARLQIWTVIYKAG